MRYFDELPLLTPEEAFERAWDISREMPVFDLGYRVRSIDSWKAIETWLRQYDVEDILIASFGLRKFDDIFDAFSMLSERGWHVWETSANVYVGGELKTVQAVRAHYRGA